MFSNTKVGDKVWSITYGWGEIITINKDCVYPLEVKYSKGSTTYTFSGKQYQNQAHTLFWNEFEIPESAYKKPLPKLEVDTKVLVWTDGAETSKARRYFKGFDKQGRIVCFREGATSFSANKNEDIAWDNWELYDETKENEGK